MYYTFWVCVFPSRPENNTTRDTFSESVLIRFSIVPVMIYEFRLRTTNDPKLVGPPLTKKP
jgi:hypothetical protein